MSEIEEGDYDVPQLGNEGETNTKTKQKENLIVENPEENEEKVILQHCGYIKDFMALFNKYDLDRITPKAKQEMEDTRNKMFVFGLDTVDTEKREPKQSQLAQPEKTKEAQTDKEDEHLSQQLKKRLDRLKLIKTEKKYEDSDTSESDSTGSDTDSSSNDESSDDSDPPKLTKKNKSMSEIEILKEVLGKLDNRKSLELDKFDEKSGESMKEYLKRFQEHCKQNVKSNRSYWPAELERHLEGETLKAFRSLKDKKDNYKDLEKKLIKYDTDMKHIRKQRAREQFKKTKYDKEENLYLYSTRLEKQFKIAYSKHSPEHSKVLRNKFISTIPKAFRKLIEMQMFSYKAKNKSIKWSTIQSYARVQDKVERIDKAEQSEEEVVINIQHQQKTDKTKSKNVLNIQPNRDQMQKNYHSENQHRDNRHNYGNYNYMHQNSNNIRQRPFTPRVSTNHFRQGYQNNTQEIRPRFSSNGNGYSPRRTFYNQQKQFNNFQYRPRMEQTHSNQGQNNRRPFERNNQANHGGNREGARPKDSNPEYLAEDGKNAKRFGPTPPQIPRCNICGRVGHYDRQCKMHLQCYSCGKYGHVSTDCRYRDNQTYSYHTGDSKVTCVYDTKTDGDRTEVEDETHLNC